MAYFRRWGLITFPKHFYPNDPKTDGKKIDKLTTPQELSGILNWTLDGLARLEAQGHFTNEAPDKVREHYIRVSDPQAAFIEARVIYEKQDEKGRDNWISKDDLYKYYRRYCNHYHLSTINRKVFSAHVNDYCMPNAVDSNAVIAGQTERVWRDIRWKKAVEMPEGESLEGAEYDEQ